MSKLLLWLIVLGWIVFPVNTRQRAYHTFRLNPEIDWSRQDIQKVWHSYSTFVGRFLSVENPLTLNELVVLCKAYATQHGGLHHQQVTLYMVDYELQNLFEKGIVLVSEWQAFPTSHTGTGQLRTLITKSRYEE